MTCWWFFQETRFVSQEGSLVRNKAFFLTELYDRVSQFVFSLKSHLKPGHTLAISSFILGHTSLMIFCYRFEEVWFGWKNSNPLLARNQTKKMRLLHSSYKKSVSLVVDVRLSHIAGWWQKSLSTSRSWPGTLLGWWQNQLLTPTTKTAYFNTLWQPCNVPCEQAHIWGAHAQAAKLHGVSTPDSSPPDRVIPWIVLCLQGTQWSACLQSIVPVMPLFQHSFHQS